MCLFLVKKHITPDKNKVIDRVGTYINIKHDQLYTHTIAENDPSQ